jgi:formylmethanofuran:tetrahydromethanopterin formyltransferase
MTKQAMSQAIKVLEKSDTVTKVDAGRYYINNVLFSLWLKRTM